jgi:hypothetical protein
METFIYQYFLEDLSLCDQLIDYHKKHEEYKSVGSSNFGVDKSIKDSTDVAIFNSSNNSAIQKYFKELSKGTQSYIDKYNLYGLYHTLDATIIQHYAPGGGYKKWHCERDNAALSSGSIMYNRALVFMTYLNDVTDKGETEWLYQNIKIQPKKGLTVIWPTDFTHTHRGIVSPTQEKYIITGWLHMCHYDYRGDRR